MGCPRKCVPSVHKSYTSFKTFKEKPPRKWPKLDTNKCKLYYFIYISPIQFENEIRSHLSQKASKGKFPEPEKLENHSNEEKGKEKKKERGEEKKTLVALLVFIIATLEMVFGRKKTVGRKRSIWR